MITGVFSDISGLKVHNPAMKRFFSGISNLASAIFAKFKNKISDSKSFRNFSSVILIIILALFIYPPERWGKWRHYQDGTASYYGRGFYCKSTASGQIYWPWLYAAAHKTLPLGAIIKVKNKDNDKVIYVRIFDRGPFVKGRILDLTKSAAHDLGIVENGLAEVEIYIKNLK
jgi:rare lipoprotein A